MWEMEMVFHRQVLTLASRMDEYMMIPMNESIDQTVRNADTPVVVIMMSFVNPKRMTTKVLLLIQVRVPIAFL